MSTLGQISENFCEEEDEVTSKCQFVCVQCQATFNFYKKVSKCTKCLPFTSPPPSFLRLG